MHALYDFVDKDTIALYNNEYNLEVAPKPEQKVIALRLQYQDAKCELLGAELLDYSAAKNLRNYFFRPAPAMSVSDFPTLYISGESLKADEVYSSESKSYTKLLRILRYNAITDPLLKPLQGWFEENSSQVFEAIFEYLENEKTLYIFTLNLNGKYIGQSEHYELIRRTAAETLYRDFYSLKDKKITGKNLQCSMCLNLQEELWGYVSVYNFYAAKTELAPLASGMKKELAHLNYPVCPECARKLKSIRPIVDKYFRFRFCGFDYLLLPELSGVDTDAEAMQLILDIMIAQYNAQPGDTLANEGRLGELTLGKRKSLIDGYSKEVFDCLSELENTASYTMLFYAESNAEFKLLLSIEDIFPSQFASIFAAKERAESHAAFQNLPGKDNSTYDLEFRFDLLKEFLPIKSKKEGDFSKAFLEITRSVFMQKPVSYDYLMSRIAAIVQSRFVNEENFGLMARKGFLLLKFFHYLGIININKSKAYKEVAMTGKLNEFFGEHAEFFGSAAKRYVFMVGVLTQYLLDIQRVDKNAEPFRKRLNSMKLDKNLVNRIFTEAIEKLNQYEKNFYRALEQEIAAMAIQGGMEALSNDEISFIFTLGMTLSKEFKTKKEENE